MVVAPGRTVGRQRVRPIAPVAVDGGRGENGRARRARGARRESRDRAETGNRPRPRASGGCSARRSTQRLMQMPAAGIVALDRRSAHEGREMTHPPAQLARRGAEQHRVVGRLQRRPRAQTCIPPGPAPTRSRSIAAAARSSRSIGERREHRLHQVHVGFRVVGEAGLRRRGPDRPPAPAGTPVCSSPR